MSKTNFREPKFPKAVEELKLFFYWFVVAFGILWVRLWASWAAADVSAAAKVASEDPSGLQGNPQVTFVCLFACSWDLLGSPKGPPGSTQKPPRRPAGGPKPLIF